MLVAVLLPSVASAEFRHIDDWTKWQKVEFATYTALTYIDYRQTTWAVKQKHPNGTYLFDEVNPILGKRPDNIDVAVLLLASVATYYYLVGKSGENPVASASARSIMMTARVAIILHNDSVGVNFNKVW